MSTIYAPQLLDALEAAARPWRGSVWRRVIGDVDPTRPNVRGARWNPPAVEALYFSLSEAGAQAELAAVIERQSIPIRRALRSFEFEVELSQVADLRHERLVSVGVQSQQWVSRGGSRLEVPQDVVRQRCVEVVGNDETTAIPAEHAAVRLLEGNDARDRLSGSRDDALLAARDRSSSRDKWVLASGTLTRVGRAHDGLSP